MRTLNLSLATAFLGLSLFSACTGDGNNQKAPEGAETNTQVAGVTYTCPMHPEVVSDVKGECPQCGMFLEEVKPGEKLDSAAAAQQHQEGEQH